MKETRNFTRLLASMTLTAVYHNFVLIVSRELVKMPRPRRDGLPATAPNKRRLSELFIRRLKPQPSPFTVWDTLQRGLAVVMQPSGHKAWKVVYSHHGRPRWYHVADASAIGLADARKLANEVMYQVAQDKDPAAERRASRNADSFEDLAIRYRKYAAVKNKSWKQADVLTRKHLLPHWGKLRAVDVSRSDVKAVMAPIEAPIVANQTLAAASAIFSWAIREEIAGIKVNPCQGVERNKTTSRERILSDSEIPQFWAAFDSGALVEGRALGLILLTGQRPGEIAHMRTEHIVDGWWTLPGDPVPVLEWPGTKNGMSHRVWLSGPAQQIIAEMDTTGRVFAGARVAYLANAMRAICTELGVERATPHDLRRTFSTTVAVLGFGRDAMNRVTNHKEGGIASVYDRHGYADENKKVMESVAAKIMTLIDGGSGNVVAFKQAV
jgi:integrase